jgi:bis(5'-nucleosyl)-tetraphosphatase (symmetrical)
MATYAIGDIQGCCDALARLLDRLRFDPAQDRLWFTGDLVNRGPQSLQTLRLVRGFGDSAVTVLGNHDLHLLAVAHGGRRGRRDSIDDILGAPDRDALLDWLRRRPMLHVSADQRIALVHAGLAPQWTLAQARSCAAEVEAALRGDDYPALLANMYGDEPDQWDAALSGLPRYRFIINCLTRLRYCDAEGRIDLKPKGPPGTQPPGLFPWFSVPRHRWEGATVVSGHWSSLGRVHWPEYAVYGLDTGCVWGRRLTALRVEDGMLQDVDCSLYRSLVDSQGD